MYVHTTTRSTSLKALFFFLFFLFLVIAVCLSLGELWRCVDLLPVVKFALLSYWAVVVCLFVSA